jgi:hypothetical protein
VVAADVWWVLSSMLFVLYKTAAVMIKLPCSAGALAVSALCVQRGRFSTSGWSLSL